MVILESGDNRRNFLRKLATSTLIGAALFGSRRGFAGREELKNWIDSNAQAGAGDEAFWKIIRQEFPLSHERTYFNCGGLGPSPRLVIDAFYDAYRRLESICETGHEEVDEVRQKAAAFLGCEGNEIAFTRNTTEGMNIIARGLPLKRGDEVLTSTHEHPGGAIPWLTLAKDIGISIRLFEPGENQIDNLNIIERSISKRTRVLSLSHITCTTGLVFPVKEISRLCRDRGILAVYDGAHPPGLVPVNLHEIGCDFYATSGHKWLLGPKGTGLLYIRNDMLDLWRPTYTGAYSDSAYDLDLLHLEYKHAAEVTEYGTRNTPLILALGAALDFLDAIGVERVSARSRHLAEVLRGKLSGAKGIKILTPAEPSSSASIVTFRFPALHNADLIKRISSAGFRTRMVGEHNLDAIRVSTHIYTSLDEIERFVDAVGALTTE